MNFKEQLDYIKNNKKIDIRKFNKVTDITNAIDFMNREVEKNIESKADKDIESISKFLVREMTQKIFILGKAGKK